MHQSMGLRGQRWKYAYDAHAKRPYMAQSKALRAVTDREIQRHADEATKAAAVKMGGR
jgi:hypothetical protein